MLHNIKVISENRKSKREGKRRKVQRPNKSEVKHVYSHGYKVIDSDPNGFGYYM